MVLEIEIDQVVEGDDNTRRTSWGDLEGLAQSMREQGQITPGLVRPIGPARYELVVGARRLRAAKLAGLDVFRAEVREMDDSVAHDVRLVENNQRADISPLEEAEAFATARDVHLRSVEDIAMRLGRATAYVYQRLRLLELVPELRESLAAGRLGVDSALLLAQYDQKAQLEIAKRWTSSWWSSGRRITRADVRDAIDSVCYQLDRAPFDVADTELVPTAGSCLTCSARTGTQGSLFEVADADLCLRPKCFDVKVEALAKRALEHAKENKLGVIEDPSVVFLASGGLRYDAPYVDLDAVARHVDDDGEASTVTWREVCGPMVNPTVAVGPTGKIFELVAKDIAQQALAASNPKFRKELEREAKAESKAQLAEAKIKEEAAREADKRAIESDARRRAMGALVASIEAGEGARDELLRKFVVALMQGTWADVMGEVARRRGLKLVDVTDKKISPAEAITREMTSMAIGQVSALAVEIVATRTQHGHSNETTGFESLCEVQHIDLAHHRKEAKAAAKEKTKAKREKEKTKKRDRTASEAARSKEVADAVA